MKIGFSKGGLTFNSKKFHPLNMGIKGYEIESNEAVNSVDAMELLESLSLMKTKKATKANKIQGLKQVMDKMNQ